jgi:hypothetical protein
MDKDKKNVERKSWLVCRVLPSGTHSINTAANIFPPHCNSNRFRVEKMGGWRGTTSSPKLELHPSLNMKEEEKHKVRHTHTHSQGVRRSRYPLGQTNSEAAGAMLSCV